MIVEHRRNVRCFCRSRRSQHLHDHPRCIMEDAGYLHRLFNSGRSNYHVPSFDSDGRRLAEVPD